MNKIARWYQRTLFAQLAANRQHEREADVLGWYRTFVGILRQLGWVNLQGQPPVYQASRSAGSQMSLASWGPVQPDWTQRPPRTLFRPIVLPGLRLSADAAVRQVVARTGSFAEIATLSRSLDAFHALGDRDRRVAIFESSSHGSSSANFQIDSVTANGSIIRMAISAFYISTTEPLTRILALNSAKANTQIYQANDLLALSESAYEPFREDVIAKLGDQTAIYVAELDIED